MLKFYLRCPVTPPRSAHLPGAWVSKQIRVSHDLDVLSSRQANIIHVERPHASFNHYKTSELLSKPAQQVTWGCFVPRLPVWTCSRLMYLSYYLGGNSTCIRSFKQCLQDSLCVSAQQQQMRLQGFLLHCCSDHQQGLRSSALYKLLSELIRTIPSEHVYHLCAIVPDGLVMLLVHDLNSCRWSSLQTPLMQQSATCYSQSTTRHYSSRYTMTSNK